MLPWGVARYALLFVLLVLMQVTAASYECLGSDSSLAQPLHVRVPSDAPTLVDFEVPAMSTNPDDYSYALEKAILLLPRRCVQDLKMDPNVGDSNGEIQQWMGRVEDLQSEAVNQDAETLLSSCACGWVIFCHGSGGFNWDNTRYAINMAAAGYGVLVPDSFAGQKLGLRYRAGIPNLAAKLREWNGKDGDHKTYWCDDNIYEASSPCNPAMLKHATHQYPLCYSSNAHVIVNHTSDWRAYYARVYRLRALELDYVMENLPGYISHAGKVFLAGESEGGMVAARYTHPVFEDLIAQGGRILLQWSCEWCYYLSCPEDARLGSGKANKNTPVLNMISYTDPFFGSHHNSIAHQVAHSPGGYGNASAAGSCFEQLVQDGIKHAFTIVDYGTTYHGLSEESGNLVRSALVAFMKAPDSGVGTFVSENCNTTARAGGLVRADCRELHDGGGRGKRVTPGDQLSCAYDKYQYHLQYKLVGEFEACSKPRDVQSATSLYEAGEKMALPSSAKAFGGILMALVAVLLASHLGLRRHSSRSDGRKLLLEESSGTDEI